MSDAEAAASAAAKERRARRAARKEKEATERAAAEGGGDEPRREEREKRRVQRTEASEDGGESGRSNPYGAFIAMDNLMDKLNLLDYDKNFCRKRDVKPISRHYFAIGSNPNEQLYLFANLMSWLLQLCGKSSFEAPEQFADPNTTVSNIQQELRSQGITTSASQTDLKQGSGEEVCNILNAIAKKALKAKHFSWQKPVHVTEAADEAEEEFGEVEEEEEEEIIEDEIGDEAFEEDEAFIDIDSTKTGDDTGRTKSVLHSAVDGAEWLLEVERVTPQLRVHIRADAKDWRNHHEQMVDHQTGIEGALTHTQGHLDRLHAEIGRTLEKISSREKYINGQLEPIIQEYRLKQDKLAGVTEKYKQASGGVTELSKTMARLSEELDKVKAEMDERGTNMTDAGPLVKIKQSLTRLVGEVKQMELRIGVVQHILLAAKVRHKGLLVNDLHAEPVNNDPFAAPAQW